MQDVLAHLILYLFALIMHHERYWCKTACPAQRYVLQRIIKVTPTHCLHVAQQKPPVWFPGLAAVQKQIRYFLVARSPD